jgi:hypothetical protein
VLDERLKVYIANIRIKIIITYTYISISVYCFRVRVMVFNATFNNMSAISWWSVLLVGKTGVHGENH